MNVSLKIEKYNKKIEKLTDKMNKTKDEIKKRDIMDDIAYFKRLIFIYENHSLKEARVLKAISLEKKKRHQILYGNVMPTIMMICLPLALYGFFNSFYSLIDSVMASSISGKSVSNVSVISQVKSMLSAFGAGLAGGGAILVSRNYGEGNLEKARRSAANLLLLCVIMSLVILTIFIPLAPFILEIAGVPEIKSDVILYFRLILFELFFVAINNVFIGLEKIKGNSKKILWLNILALIIKLIFNVIFIYGIKVDSIIYLEISTIIGQAILFTIGVFILFSKKNLLKIYLKNMVPYKDFIVIIFKLSIPIFLGKFVMSLGKAWVNKLCGMYYSEATDGLIIGALGISNNLSGLVTSTTNVFEEGESSIVSQNIGNKNLKRTVKVFVNTLILVSIISLIGFVLVRFVFLDFLTNLFNQKGDIRLTNYVKEIFYYDCLSIPALGLTSALLGLLYGYGKTFLSSILNFSRIGIRILSLITCHAIGLNYKAAGISMGISNILIFILALIFLIIFMVRLKKKGYKDLKIEDSNQERKELIF